MISLKNVQGGKLEYMRLGTLQKYTFQDLLTKQNKTQLEKERELSKSKKQNTLYQTEICMQNG